MRQLFDPQYGYVWTVVLAVALFIPVRQLIWVLSVRRAERRGGETLGDEERQRLRRRAGATAILLCFVFSFFYVSYLFGPGQ